MVFCITVIAFQVLYPWMEGLNRPSSYTFSYNVWLIQLRCVGQEEDKRGILKVVLFPFLKAFESNYMILF